LDLVAPAGSLRGDLSAFLRRGFGYLLARGPLRFFLRLLQPWIWLTKSPLVTIPLFLLGYVVVFVKAVPLLIHSLIWGRQRG
jgi:hypothetical protein